MKNSVVEILLVEDNQDDEELALRALKKNHLSNSIEVARDGEEALRFLFGEDGIDTSVLHKQPRLILLDLKLPKVDGLEVLKQIKQHPSGREIPVVILTTSAQEPDMKRAYELGVNSYLIKPVDFEHFVEIVRKLGFYWLLLNQAPGSKGL